MTSAVKTGSYTGTGVAQDIEVGFVPDHLEIINVTDGNARWTWFNGMAASNALQIAADGTQTLLTSNGINAFEGEEASRSKGFSVRPGLSIAAKEFRYIASRDVD